MLNEIDRLQGHGFGRGPERSETMHDKLREANAIIDKLEATNAELLKALEAAEQYLAFHSLENCQPVPLMQVRATIKKATGD